MNRLIVGLVGLCCRAPRMVILIAALLALLAGGYAAMNFAMTTDTAQLISSKVDWRRHEQAVDAAFPQSTDRIVVVVDGRTPEIAEQAAAALADKLAQRKDAVITVERPDGGAFFAQDGLLLLPLKDVQATTSQVIQAQPFLGPLAADTSLRGVMKSLSAMTQGVQQGQTTLAAIDKPMKGLADAVEKVLQGRPAYFSWEELMQSDAGGLKTPLRRLVLIQAKLDYGALEPGAHTADVIRQTAKDLGLDQAHGVRVRLTGEVPLADEEFSSLADNAWLVTGAMLGTVILMLWLATRSFRLVSCILATTIVGLVITAGLGLAAVGRFNLISVAFIPLFVGLGIDFGIQLSVRFRAERFDVLDVTTALCRAAAGIGGALAVAAAAITLGLFAFLPTSYIGVSELGVIAGLGMIIALLLTLTLLPALLTLIHPPDQGLAVGNPELAPLDRFLIQRRGWVLGAFGVSVLISIALVPMVQFDFNPLHLRNPKGEAMATLSDLMRDQDQSPNAIDILEPSLAKADAVAAQVSRLPSVDQAVTLSSFVPEDQQAKLALVQDASLLMDPTINPLEISAPPTDADTVQSLRDAANSLRAAAASSTAPGADARRLAAALDALAAAPVSFRERASQVIVTPLNTMLDQVRSMLAAQSVTMQGLPPVLVRDWTAPDGAALVQVFPKKNDNQSLKTFAAEVRKIAPNASGGPISVQEAAKTIAGAFIEAGILSLIAVTLLLLVVLRSFRETAFTLAPVVLSGFLTLSTCVLIGQPINFANIIAFPLLFGVGVAFHIYFVMAWRAGQADLLQSPLTRAVFFSALTTGVAFGSLWISKHPGTASMGKILMISIVWTLVCALLFEPALLGPPKRVRV